MHESDNNDNISPCNNDDEVEGEDVVDTSLVKSDRAQSDVPVKSDRAPSVRVAVILAATLEGMRPLPHARRATTGTVRNEI